VNKETEALEEYMSQQQRKINDLTQTVLLLQTKNVLLEKELLTFRGYILEKNEIQVSRQGIINSNKSRNERVTEIKRIDNFTTEKKQIPVEREGFCGFEGKKIQKNPIILHIDDSPIINSNK
jgi:hypothetical protein